MASAITALGGILEGVAITSLRDRDYIAELRLRQGGRIVSVDVRPSDAIAMSLELKAPIWVADVALQAALGKGSC